MSGVNRGLPLDAPLQEILASLAEAALELGHEGKRVWCENLGICIPVMGDVISTPGGRGAGMAFTLSRWAWIGSDITAERGRLEIDAARVLS